MGRTGQALGWATLTGSGVTLFPAGSCGTAPGAPARLQVMCPSASHSIQGSQSCAHTLSLPLLTLCAPRPWLQEPLLGSLPALSSLTTGGQSWTLGQRSASCDCWEP